MTRHDDPLQELIDASEELVSSLNHGLLVSSQWYALDEALKPFRPDPEEELIEAMVEAMKPLWYKYPMPGPPHDELARAVLEVVKERGLPQ